MQWVWRVCQDMLCLVYNDYLDVDHSTIVDLLPRCQTFSGNIQLSLSKHMCEVIFYPVRNPAC